jgi:hypothetical protein
MCQTTLTRVWVQLEPLSRSYRPSSNNWLRYADCPGTSSGEAGKAAACEGCPNQAVCATAPKGPDPGKSVACVKSLAVESNASGAA